MQFFVGIDIGGTNTKAVLLNSKQKELCSLTMPTQASEGKKTILKNAIEAISLVSENKKISKIGIALAGTLDNEKKFLYCAPNLKAMEKVKIAEILQKKFKLPILLENDAKAAAFAESKLCNNNKTETLVLLTLGTGIGSGIVFNGKLFHGATELGHMIIEENNNKCGCGKRGCFETITNARFLSQTARALEKKHKTGLKKFDGLSLQKAASNGNKNAKLAYKKMAENLGIGLANICNLLNPDKIVLAGGLANAKIIFPIARKKMLSLSIRKNKEKCKLEKTKIGKLSGAIGAALIAMEK